MIISLMNLKKMKKKKQKKKAKSGEEMAGKKRWLIPLRHTLLHLAKARLNILLKNNLSRV